jgi:hypothetical protein
VLIDDGGVSAGWVHAAGELDIARFERALRGSQAERG